jgi:hypothetical protein
VSAALISLPSTVAASPLVVLADSSPAISDADGGAHATTLALTNLTDSAATLNATPTQTARGCQLSLKPAMLPAAEGASVEVSVPAACEIPKTGFSFDVVAKTPTGGEQAALPVITKPASEKASANWKVLYVYPAMIAVLLAAALVLLLRARFGGLKRPLKTRLEHLPDAWTFKDSWASNVTVAGALLTGVLGTSDVVKTFLGEKADAALAVATVGAAISAALVGAAGIVAIAFRGKKQAGKYFFTVGGLYAAVTVAMIGAFGELVVVADSASRFDMKGVEDWVWPIFALAGLLLAFYALRSVPQTIDVGMTSLTKKKTKKTTTSHKRGKTGAGKAPPKEEPEAVGEAAPHASHPPPASVLP